MKTLDLIQGTPEWLEARAKFNTASEAPAMMGVSPYQSRGDLLRQKHSGITQEFTPEQQAVFDRGHEAEDTMRPWAEEQIGQELFPATVVEDDGNLSASLDGMTMAGDIIWEHKQFNKAKVQHIKDNDEPPMADFWQVVQQLMITGAKRCLYSVGNDPDDVASCWVEPDPIAFSELRAGWNQFDADLADYVPPETPVEVVGHTMETLPALRIELTGMVTNSNLSAYKDHALAVFDSINTDLQTDQDFADAENTVKWCKDVEDRLDAAKQHALSQTEDIDALFRTLDDLKESARQKRLELDKLVKARKVAVRDDIRRDAEKALQLHLDTLRTRLDGRVIISVPVTSTDFVNAMKGKRTISSLRDAVDQVLADAKIASSAQADAILANLKTFDELAADYGTLFPDLEQLTLKAPEDFAAAIKLRIAEHKEAEERRAAAERAAEEERRARAEQAEAAKQAASAPQPEPPAPSEPAAEANVEPPVGKTVQTRKWTVTVTFEIEAPEQYGADAIEGRLHKALSGFSSLRDVTAEESKARKAA